SSTPARGSAATRASRGRPRRPPASTSRRAPSCSANEPPGVGGGVNESLLYMNAFLVGGSASGVGKTTVTLALLAAFRERGLRVQPFKAGPDFIDPGHHAAVAGVESPTLDAWMVPPEENRRIFSQAAGGRDVAVVEGMMGLFDGVAGDREEGSSAALA